MNTAPENQETGRAPSHPEQTLGHTTPTAPTTEPSQPAETPGGQSTHRPKRYVVALRKTVYHVAVVKLHADSPEAAFEEAERQADQYCLWEAIGADVDPAYDDSVELVEEEGQEEGRAGQ